MLHLLTALSTWSVPVIILIILIYGYLKNVKVYEAFTEGAGDGIKTVIKILPYLVAMMVAINIFRSSGALDILLNLLYPIFENLHIPKPVLPLAFLRPLTGSGSLAYVSKLLSEYGPDSLIGKMASTVQGSTETTFYIIAVYFGAIGIKKYRYAITVGLLADIAGFFAAIFICNLLFIN